MAMTTKGIQYFPLDVNFFEDDKIAVIINDYGFEAVGVTLKLFSQIYKNGFYMNWNDKICKVFATTFRSGYDSEELNRLVHDLISEMVFDTEMFEKYQILTSKEIQKNFFRVISRRKSFEMEHPEYLLIAIPEKRTNWGNVCKNGEIAYKNAKNVDNFQQSKVKESKVKESKENTTPCSRAREGETKYSFPDLCRSYRAELAKDEEWLFAVSQLSGQGGAEIKKRRIWCRPARPAASCTSTTTNAVSSTGGAAWASNRKKTCWHAAGLRRPTGRTRPPKRGRSRWMFCGRRRKKHYLLLLA